MTPLTSEVYALQSINGQPLPAFISNDSFRQMDVLRGSLVIATSGRYTSRLVIRETLNGASTIRESVNEGTYSRTKSSLTLKNDNGTETTLRIEGTRLVYLSDGGKQYLYIPGAVQE